MKIHNVVLSTVLISTSAAQINLSSILSDVQSVYTVFTSVLANPPTSTTSTSSRTTTSSSSTTTTSSSSTSSSSFLTSTSSASVASTPSSSTPAQSSSASAAAASSTSNNSSGSGSSNTLPIVLGCTLGALAVAAFIGLIFLCRRRSRKSKTTGKRRAQSLSDNESEVWNSENYHRNSFKGPTERTRSLGATNTAAGAPLMSQHGHSGQYAAYGPSLSHDNSVPTLPPATRFSSGTGTRVAEDDATSYTAHPFSPDHVHSHGTYPESSDGQYHKGSNLAAGVGGAAIGGLAAHATDHDDHRRSESRSRRLNGVSTTYSEDELNSLPQAAIGSPDHDRRSGSVSRASVKEPWPFADAHDRRSTDSSHPRPVSRGRDHFVGAEQQQYGAHSVPSDTALAGGVVAGGLIGAATAREVESRSPHRRGILKQTTSSPPVPSILLDDDVTTRKITAHNSGPYELASPDVTPAVHPNREQVHSPLGTTAPVAAIGANRATHQSRPRSWSNSSGHTNPRPASLPHESSQDSDTPIIPSRSPRRNSLHSNARYSTANEGTAELSSHEEPRHGASERGVISPSLGAHQGALYNDGLVSPISPDSSLPSTWSKTHAPEFGMNATEVGPKSSSQESTAVGYSPLNSNSTSSKSSAEQSSGLVTAIQRIFNSQKQAWPGEESETTALPRRSFGDRAVPMTENVYEDSRQVSSVPHRKPAPVRTIEHGNQRDETRYNGVETTAMPGGWNDETASLPPAPSRKSIESLHSRPLNPERFYAHMTSAEEVDQSSTTRPQGSTNVNMNTGRSRSNSRPGYGIGSGDPFDLARIRTDSSMTGVSLNNDTESNSSTGLAKPTGTTQRSHAYKPSNEYREPTLAELKREVQEEDRQRRASWKSTRRHSHHSRKSVEGQRYGNDEELFDLAYPGNESYEHFYGQGHGRGTGVGTAY